MLQVKDLTKIYGVKNTEGGETHALNGITADFGDRGLIFVLGKSGCGKTTLLNLLGGLDVPTSGEIRVDGRLCENFSEHERDNYRNTYIGFIFQEYNLIPEYSVGENVALALELQGKTASREEVEAVLRQVELVDEAGNSLYDRNVNKLSGGQKQRVAIARALIKEPRVILADEPTGALDGDTGEEIYKLLKELSKEKTVIVVTHDRDGAEKWGNRIIELKNGKILKDTVLGEPVNSEICGNTEQKSFFVTGKLPFKRIFSMGINGLKQKKARMILSVILSVISFVIFGFSCVAAMQDENMTEIKTLYKHGQETFIIASDQGDPLTDRQLKAIEEYAGERGFSVLTMNSVRVSDHLNVAEDQLELLRNPYVYFATRSSNFVAELDNQSTLNLQADERFLDKSLCRLPETYDEIAITDIRADMYIRYGYKAEDGMAYEIKTPDDLIGKEVDGFTICGVYSTEQDTEFFKKFDINNYMYTAEEVEYWDKKYKEDGVLIPVPHPPKKETESSVYHASMVHTTTAFSFVKKGYREHIEKEEGVNYIALRLSGKQSTDRTLFKKLNYKEGKTEYRVEILTAYSNSMEIADLLREFQWLAFTVAAVFVVFCILLTMNFLLVSLDFRKREIGILRALGAGKRDVAGICLTESMSLAVLETVISLALIFMIGGIINLALDVELFIVGGLPVFFTVLLSIGVTGLATIIPLRRTIGKRPVDILNEK